MGEGVEALFTLKLFKTFSKERFEKVSTFCILLREVLDKTVYYILTFTKWGRDGAGGGWEGGGWCLGGNFTTNTTFNFPAI